MPDDLQIKKEKDLLWDYTKTVSALEAFRANFRSLADSFEMTATLLREHPEELADLDFRGTQEKFDAAMVSAKEYREMLYRNAERKASLIKMGILS
jgi:hypothetical protein